jgi:hypothetical protein
MPTAAVRGLDHFQDVGEFVRELFGGRFLRFAGLFNELGQQRHLIARSSRTRATGRWPCDSMISRIRSRTSLS